MRCMGEARGLKEKLTVRSVPAAAPQPFATHDMVRCVWAYQLVAIGPADRFATRSERPVGLLFEGIRLNEQFPGRRRGHDDAIDAVV